MRFEDRRDGGGDRGGGGEPGAGPGYGANDRVRLGFIGVGNRGCQLLKGFLPMPDAQVVALVRRLRAVSQRGVTIGSTRGSPVWVKRIAQMPKIGGDVARVKDFRRSSIGRTSTPS